MKTIALCPLLSLGLARALCLAAPGDLDPAFDAGSSLDRPVRAIARLENGKILIAGDFTVMHGTVRGGIARLNADGTADAGFMANLSGARGANGGSIDCMAVQPDGKILIGGSFTNVNGTARNRIARLQPDGALDLSFTTELSGADDRVRALVILANGRIIIGGCFSSINGVNRSLLAGLNADGSLDTTFVPAIGDPAETPFVYALATDKVARILVGGSFNSVNGTARTNLARLEPTGALDTTFQPVITSGASGRVASIVLQADERILIDGNLSVPVFGFCGVARLNSDGSLDQQFQPGSISGLAGALVLGVQEDQKVLIGGDAGLMRLKADGSRDYAFNVAGLLGQTYAATILTDQKIVIGGAFQVNSMGRRHIARFNGDGTLDMSFCPGSGGPDGPVHCSTVPLDGRVVIGGMFHSVNGMSERSLARLNLDGSLDSSFENSYLDVLSHGIQGLVAQSDGRLVVAGDGYVHRVSADGSLDNSFHSPALVYWEQDPFPGNPPRSARGAIESLLSLPNDRSLVRGRFDTVDGAGRTNLALLERDGALGPPLAPAPGYPLAACVEPDGKLLVAHELASSGTLTIWRFTRDGARDDSFVAPSLSFAGGLKRISALASQTNGRTLVGGGFTSVNNVSYTNLTRLHSDGSVDPSFHSPLSEDIGDVRSILVQPDGRVLIFGAFTRVGNVPAPGMARLEPDGSPDVSFHWTGLDEGARIMSSSLTADGKLFITGDFFSVNGVPRRGIALLWLRDRLPAMLNCRFEYGKFTFDVTGEPERTVVAERSVDLQVWTPFWTNTLGTSPVLVQDKGGTVRECFYRLKNP